MFEVFYITSGRFASLLNTGRLARDIKRYSLVYWLLLECAILYLVLNLKEWLLDFFDSDSERSVNFTLLAQKETISIHV